MPFSDQFLKDMESYKRGDSRIIRKFKEIEAINWFQDSEVMSHLPWKNYTRGNPDRKEPDYIIKNGKNVIAGFELTQMADQGARSRNIELDKLRKKKPMKSISIDQQSIEQRDALQAYDIANEFGSETLEMQGFCAIYSKEKFLQSIKDRIKAKTDKDYVVYKIYPIHLIVYEASFVGCETNKEIAITSVDSWDEGNFDSIWYIDRFGGKEGKVIKIV